MKKFGEVRFKDFDIDIPIVKFLLGGKEYFAIVDTGCEDSLFDESLKDYAYKIDDANINLIGFAGETSVVKMATFNIDFPETNAFYRIKAHLTDMSTISSSVSGRLGEDIEISAFIGSSFLKENKCDIDYKRKVLLLK